MSLQSTENLQIRSLSGGLPRRWTATTCVAAVLFALAGLPADAATYKWVDANGRVIYSDQPPNGNFKVESISAPPPPANPNAVRELANKESELQQKKLLRADEEAKATKARIEDNKKRDQCGKVRGQITMMGSDRNVVYYRANEKGEQVYMDDAALRQQRAQLEAWVRENCAA